MQTKADKLLRAVSYIILVLLLLVILVPLMIMVLGSFKDPTEAQRFNLAFPTQWHFENYTHVFEEGGILRALKNSCIITVSVTAIVVITGSLCAFIISRKATKFTSGVYYLFLLGMISPLQIVTSYALLKVLNLTGTYVGVILLTSAVNMPWTVFTLTGFIKNIPKELDEAAYLDGAGPVTLFFRIILPLMRPITATVLVTTAMGAWNDFMIPLYFFNSSEKWTMPLTVYNFFGRYASNWNYVFVDLILTALPITILYLAAQKYVISGMTDGAVKG